jgi:hypothetical protein
MVGLQRLDALVPQRLGEMGQNIFLEPVMVGQAFFESVPGHFRLGAEIRAGDELIDERQILRKPEHAVRRRHKPAHHLPVEVGEELSVHAVHRQGVDEVAGELGMEGHGVAAEPAQIVDRLDSLVLFGEGVLIRGDHLRIL